MIIRRAEQKDIDAVYGIELASFSDPWTRDDFMAAVQSPAYIFLVADGEPENAAQDTEPPGGETKKQRAARTESGEISGYVCLFHAADEGDVASIAVPEKHRRAGIGRLLLKTALREAEARGVKKIFLEVRKSNEPAQRLYADLGFRQIGIRRDYYENPREDALLMRCEY